jgi:hypothetical protein
MAPPARRAAFAVGSGQCAYPVCAVSRERPGAARRVVRVGSAVARVCRAGNTAVAGGGAGANGGRATLRRRTLGPEPWLSELSELSELSDHCRTTVSDMPLSDCHTTVGITVGSLFDHCRVGAVGLAPCSRPVGLMSDFCRNCRT